jgi:acyl-CoA synthetase (AMP-forming)/AMP-acid ligase II
MTYGEAAARVSGISARLSDAGIGPGDRVAILTENDPLGVLGVYAASTINAVAVPINPRLTPASQVELIRASTAKAVVALASRTHALVEDGQLEKQALATFCIGEGDQDWLPLDDEIGSDEVAAEVGLSDDGTPIAVQSYTSGTTGVPKGALLRHEMFAAQSMRWGLAGLSVSPGEVLYVPLPIMLTAGLCMAFHSVWCGGTLYPTDFDAEDAFKAVSSVDVQAIVLVPAMLHMVMEVADRSPEVEARLKWLFYGTAPMPPRLLERALQRFDCAFFQGYGATESSGLTLMNAEDHIRALSGSEHLLRSVGRVAMGCDVAILGPDGLTRQSDVTGEIVARGDPLFAGYFDAPERTAAAFYGSWYQTGDLGHFDSDGYLYLVDRKDNMIVSGGMNIAPSEVEAVIAAMPGVLEVAVVGVPDEKWSQKAVAVVVLQPETQASAEDVLTFCSSRLPGFKRPKEIVFDSSLPRNANGKVQHFEVRRRVIE